MTLGALSHVGMARSSNQDSLCALAGADAPPNTDVLLAVADGMGGHKAGDVASDMAIRGLVDRLSRETDGTGEPGSLVSTLQRTIDEINSDIHAAAALPETRGMGTTLTAAALVGETLALGHVGDSRAYLLRRGEMRQLTRDHSWVANQVAEGTLSEAEAEQHPWRNILTRAVGVDPQVQVDGLAVTVEEGDVLLLCSDGLHSMLGSHEIARALERREPRSSSRLLVDIANAKGGYDNIAVVVARVDRIGSDLA